jgi:hypothetical protein
VLAHKNNCILQYSQMIMYYKQYKNLLKLQAKEVRLLLLGGDEENERRHDWWTKSEDGVSLR